MNELRRKYDQAKKIIHELKKHEQFLAVQLQVRSSFPKLAYKDTRMIVVDELLFGFEATTLANTFIIQY